MNQDNRDNKDFDESKLDAAEIRLTSENPILSKLSNFWYYHKWTVIVVTFFAVIIVVGLFQILTKEDSDEAVIVAAPMTFYAEHIDGINVTLSSLMPKNEDGSQRKLDVHYYQIFSEEEMDKLNHEETDSEGHYVKKVDQSYNTSKIQEYNQFLQTGECSLLFIPSHLYEKQKELNRLRSLSEIFGEELPECAMADGYGVRLGDTYAYEFFPELQALPEDTVICLLRPYIHGASSKEERYAATVEFFKNIVTFGEQ